MEKYKLDIEPNNLIYMEILKSNVVTGDYSNTKTDSYPMCIAKKCVTGEYIVIWENQNKKHQEGISWIPEYLAFGTSTEGNIECFANDDDNSHIDIIPAPANFLGSPELESLSLTTDSGEEFATTNIPKDVIDNAKKFFIIYDEGKKEYYLQVE
ncbi:MAG: hypothetical protein LUH21_04290 [Clostridiales bacterium]|nr:hypothetical protein [Clostridiales bacterium]